MMLRPYVSKRFLICFVVFCVGTVATDGRSRPGRHGRQDPAVVELTLYPAKAPEPKDKYQLLPRPDPRSDSDAVGLYEKAAELLPKNFERTQVSDWLETPLEKLPLEQVRSSLQQFKSGLKLIEKASRRGHCRWPGVKGPNTFIPKLTEYRDFASLLALQARAQIAERQYDRAIETMQTGFGMARHIAQGPTLIQGMVGTAIAALVLKQAEQLLQGAEAPNFYWALKSLPVPLVDVTKQMKDEMANIDSQYRSPLTRRAMKRILRPAHERIRMLMNKLDRHVAALQCIEAMRLYAAGHDGKFPNQLSDVTEVSVPVNPFTGKPFAYRRTGTEAVLEALAPKGGAATAKDAMRYNLTLKE